MHAYSGEEQGRTTALGAIAVLAVIAAIGLNWAFVRQAIAPAWLFSAPTVAGCFGLLFLAMDRTLWRWAPVRSLGVVNTPNIDGTYEGTLTSTYHGATTRPVRIAIDQTWTRIAVRFQVIEPETSTSYSMTAGLGRSGHQRARLTYTYRNQTRPGIADTDMNDHDGTAELEFHEDGTVTGRYYNFRGRQGTLALSRIPGAGSGRG